MNMQLKAYAYLWKLFRERQFSVNDFAQSFESGNPRKFLSDLARNNLVKRIKRGVYAVIKPEAVVESALDDEKAFYDLPNESSMKYAFARKDAVLIWSDGYYWAGFKQCAYPIHLQVKNSDLKKWKKFFSDRRVPAVTINENINQTIAGVLFVLDPVKKVSAVKNGKYFVVPLTKTLEFCRVNIFEFEPAIEYLNKKYKLKKQDKWQYLES